MARGPKQPKEVETLRHAEARRRNIPTAELETVMADEDRSPVRVAYERRNRDLDPQLVWRGKDEQDWSDLVVQAPPLYIQEKVHPKVIIDELVRESKARRDETAPEAPDLFADFNGLADPEAVAEFYQHDHNWSNRMILGDSLQVMASLAEREGLRGKVQCIYLDPPYGIKFNSNFQWSTTSRDVKDGNKSHISREPEQVKAFRDTWRDGIHSYLTYLRDRLTVARDLLSESGSIFVQIGDENVHRVRALMDEVFGEENFVSEVTVSKTTGATSLYLSGTTDFVIWFSKSYSDMKFRRAFLAKEPGEQGGTQYTKIQLVNGHRRPIIPIERKDPTLLPSGSKHYRIDNMTSQRPPGDFPVSIHGKRIRPSRGYWKTGEIGMSRLGHADRLGVSGRTLTYIRYIDDFPVFPVNNLWTDTVTSGFASDKRYIVETLPRIVERCILMTTDPGDLVLDPTCGSGTTAYVAEQWGRRWITIDTSRVALALARARVMGARYPYYLLADSPEGQRKEAEVTRAAPSDTPTRGDVRQGFVYERVPHITLKSIANNAEIDVIWERFQEILEPLRERLNAALDESWEEWEIPREADPSWPAGATAAHTKWWEARIARQREVDASIAAKADFEYLYDKPYVDTSRVRVAGPFTVESLSPHRVLAVDQDDELMDDVAAADGTRRPESRAVEADDFTAVMLEQLRTAGVQQAHKEGRISFATLQGWPGNYVCAEGRYAEGREPEEARSGEGATGSGRIRRAAIFIGPEFGTVARPDLVAAAREAADGGFDVLIACAFNFDAHSSEFDRLGRVPVLKARMNADLHMADALKNTGAGNLFVVFGEPDIEIEEVATAGDEWIRVRIRGVDIFHPQSGEIEASGPEGIACWFVDTDYNEESFFVRQAYFLGAATDPYKALKTTLKAEIDEDAWASLNSDVSRPFPKPATGRIAVKVINHLGDEVMKIFRVG